MPRKTLDHLGYPRTTAKEAEGIRQAAERRRVQMLPNAGPIEPSREEPVSHFKGQDTPIMLGPQPDALPETEDSDDAAEQGKTS